MKRYSPGLRRRNDESLQYPEMMEHEGGHYFKCADAEPHIKGLEKRIDALYFRLSEREKRFDEVVNERNSARFLLREVLRNVLVGVPPELEERIEQYLGKK